MTIPQTVSETLPQTDWLAEAQRICELEQAEPPRQGAPSLLEDIYRVNRFLIAMANGNYRSVAASVAGFARETLFHLERRAKDGYIPAIAFFNAVEKAESQAEEEMVTCVRDAAKKGPQFWAAGMTYLERRQPDRWGKRQDDSQAPKVIVQIGTQHGDVSVSLAPSPQIQPTQSETLQIQAINSPVSDKVDYVNQAKWLTSETIDVPRRIESEAPGGPARRGKPRGTRPRAGATSPRRGRSRAKGVSGG